MISETVLKAIKILVVEDESLVAEDIKDFLEGLEYSVTAVVDTGEEAIKKAAETQPNLVLMDIRLKGEIDGITAAQEIWDLFNIPIVYLTANSDIDTLERTKIIGSFSYITKPFKERELHNAVEFSIYRYQLEKKLADREKWLDTILNSIGDAVIATDEQSRIMFLNSTAEALTGWKQKDVVGRNLTEVFNIANTETNVLFDIPITHALHEKVTVNSSEQKILITKNGAAIPIDDNVAPLKDHQGNITGTVLIFRDISERKQAEISRLAMARSQQLEIQMAELERINRLKDDFLSTVSHELRTPMANIKIAIKMLELALTQSSGFLPTTSRYLQILNSECEREIELINNLLDLQKLEAGVQPLASEVIHLQTWLPQLIKPFQERAQNRQQTLQVDIPTDLPPLVCDSAGLERILAELLNNACKYTPPEEQIAIAIRVQEAVMHLQISNSGVQIPADELPRIFEKFYRVPSTDPWKQGGTGLGLALVKRLAEHLGGCISVTSEHGNTCFTLHLPLHAHTAEDF